VKVVSRTQKAGIAALGTFDGLHLGHQAIVARAKAWALELALPVTVITFRRHPLELWGKAPPALMTLRQKESALAELGVDMLLPLDFTPKLAGLTGHDFIAFLRRLGVRGAVVGYNYTFGKGGEAGPGELALWAPFPVKIVEKVEAAGIPVSSSRIREALSAGEMMEARQLLGRSYAISGTVVSGAGRGRILGFPTANLEVPPEILLPKEGVYTVRAAGANMGAGGAVLNLGPCPTFGQMFQTIELFLPNFQGDLYGQTLTVEFIRYLRPQRRFAEPALLVRQIKADLAELRKDENLV
jgi:riboflavin kinase/FMN adenylyltransferase